MRSHIKEKRAQSPNDPKLSDGGGLAHGLRGGSAGSSPCDSPEPFVCSAWLGALWFGFLCMAQDRFEVCNQLIAENAFRLRASGVLKSPDDELCASDISDGVVVSRGVAKRRDSGANVIPGATEQKWSL